ncbi:molybdenum cofactor guanylyltransferase MobA [Pararhodobacter zhoushanensis]|uniref:molybdenum cofactor guanylyltransferase MobA n=1 Tax=Pararhodobacter zhoushanensis TaxID=2479545 RepID=UPI000F8E681B|nr:molybdenum cofactor guanylyltransferase MobA [Pararhodobacter zhoushanensis]
MIAGIVLAGGRATRMGGGDKALLPFGGRPLLAHVLARVGPQVGAVAISANGDPARFAGFGLPVLADPVAGFPGPLAGVLAGMDWAHGLGAEAVLCVAGDTPFLPVDLVARLSEAGAFALAASASDGRMRQHPTVGLWPVRLREALREALARGENKVGRFAAEHGAVAVPFDALPDPFFNINTPDDLRAAEALL